jgi:DNA-binding NtrC family response regulator
MMSSGVLIIEDEARLAKNIQTYLNRAGFDAQKSLSGIQGLEEVQRFKPDIVLLDFRLPDLDGLEILDKLLGADPRIKVIMMTGEGSIEVAVAAMKAGAYDYLTKPLDLKTLELLVKKAAGQERLEGTLKYYQQREAEKSGSDKLLGTSAPMHDLRRKIGQFVQAEYTLKDGIPASVLVTGETGTGKELAARAIHFDGPRRDRPFVEVNCAAIPAHILEAELFGYERGAFTDARERKLGLVEAADGGTLFLDEIGEVDLAVQSKLLKLLEDRIVRRLGGLRDRKIDVRIVAATNQPLETRIREGQFRSDLYYRLKILQIELPPLRAREEDILLLANHFLERFGASYGKPMMRFGAAAKRALLAHDWPGNVRELRNSVEQTVLLAQDPVIEPGQLGLGSLAGDAVDPTGAAGEADPFQLPGGGVDLEELERSMVVQALERTGGNVTRAAKLLGLSRDTLRYRIEKFNLIRAV